MTCCGCNVVSVDRMLISILAVSVGALAPWACDLKDDNLLSPLHLMCDLRNPSLACIQV